MSKLTWLIEYRKNGATQGYLADIRKFDGYDVFMTRDPHQAMKFDTKVDAENIISDTAFLHAMGDREFAVAEHMFDCGLVERQ